PDTQGLHDRPGGLATAGLFRCRSGHSERGSQGGGTGHMLATPHQQTALNAARSTDGRAGVALVQYAPVFLDRAATLDKAVTAVAEAAQAGAQLIFLPEAFVPGYPACIWRLRPGTDMALAEQLHARLRSNAVDLSGD